MYGSHQSSKVACSRAHGERRLLDVAHAGLDEELDEVTLPRAGESGFVLDIGIDLVDRVPVDAQRALATRVIPHRRRDDAAGARDTCHLANARDRIGHEVDDELRQRSIERVRGKRQLLGGGLLDLDAGMALARSRDERLRWVDGRDVLGAERAGPAPSSAPRVRSRRRARAGPQPRLPAPRAAARAAPSSGP